MIKPLKNPVKYYHEPDHHGMQMVISIVVCDLQLQDVP